MSIPGFKFKHSLYKVRRYVFGRLLYGLVAGIIAVNLVMVIVAPASVSGYFTGCVANINPTQGNIGAAYTFTITVNNTGGGDLQWIDITMPSVDYISAGNSIGNGWTTTDHTNDNGVTISGSAIQAGQSEDFQVIASTSILASAPKDWVVKVAPDANGSNSFSCTGSLQTSLGGQLPQDSSSGVSAVTVKNITTTSATITWNTDFPASTLVYYGRTSNYSDHTNHDLSNISSHSVQITGLTAKTAYHFQVAGTNGQGNIAYSIDNTFVTADVAASGSGGGKTSGPVTGPVVVPGSAGDNVVPKVNIATTLARSYKAPPVITGSASDNVGVGLVEYSIDGGKNWLPVNALNNAGKPDVTFSFTPTVSKDGNYDIVVRATDGAGNSVVSPLQTLVIDKLPPIVGGDVTSVGAQMVKPNDQGVTRALIGSDMHISLSAVGGPTTIAIDAVRDGKKKTTQSFSLTQSPVTGLWSGVLNFQFAATYQLSVRALDGAGNRTDRQLGVVTVDQPASIRDSSSGKALDGTLTVFYRDPETQTWALWDGSSYDQSNPMRSTQTEGYGVYLPGGTYYFEAKASGYAPTITKSFSLSEPTIISSDLKLSRRPGLHVGPIDVSIPWFGNRQDLVDLGRRSANVRSSSTLDKPLPNFNLSTTSGTPISLDKLYGKPTVLVFVSTWAAPARDQLSILNELDMKNINVLPVGAGESGSRISSYMKVAGFIIPAAIDDANKLTSELGVSGLPTTLFVDRHGVVKKVMVGVLSKEEIVKNVSSGL